MTKYELSQLYWIGLELRRHQHRLDKLREQSEKITTSYDHGPRSGGIFDKTGESAAEIADLIDLILQDQRKYEKERVRLFRKIREVKDGYVRHILTLRYIDHLTWREVAEVMGPGYTADAVRMAHNRFLEEQ